MTEHLREVALESEQVFRGKLLDVRRDRVRLPDGHEGVREYLRHPGAVVIIAVQDDGQLDRKSTRLNSSHIQKSRMPSSA